MNSSLPEEPASIGLITLFLDFVPKPWAAGRPLTALTKCTHLKARLDSFARIFVSGSELHCKQA